MIQFTRFSLLLGMAASLMATTTTPATLSFGEITLVTPATTPPTYMVNLVLSTANSSFPGQVAGFQFDVNYDPTSLNVTIGLGPQATTASMQLNTVCLGVAIGSCATPASFNPSTTAPQNPGPGQRAIIIGCCTVSQQTPTSNLLTDGVVATLMVQATASPTNWTLTFPTTVSSTAVNYMAATSQGGQNVAAGPIALVVGAGSNDPNATGVLDMSKIYLVGGISPETATSVGGFGSGQLKLADLIAELLYETGAPGYTLPAACTDFFDAMDTSPADTATTRGGDGQITLPDLILELLRQTGAPGFSVLPVRIARGETCTSNTKSHVVTAAKPEVRGTLVLGSVEGAGTSQERVPVYLEAGRDLTRAAIAFSIGDEKSQLRFQSAPGMSPSLMYDSQPGFVSVAFLSGFDAHGGDRTLLGYVVGPAGSGANLKVFGVSGAGLNNLEVFGIDSVGVVRQ
jgi:hypothetical protein